MLHFIVERNARLVHIFRVRKTLVLVTALVEPITHGFERWKHGIQLFENDVHVRPANIIPRLVYHTTASRQK